MILLLACFAFVGNSFGATSLDTKIPKKEICKTVEAATPAVVVIAIVPQIGYHVMDNQFVSYNFPQLEAETLQGTITNVAQNANSPPLRSR